MHLAEPDDGGPLRPPAGERGPLGAEKEAVARSDVQALTQAADGSGELLVRVAGGGGGPLVHEDGDGRQAEQEQRAEDGQDH